MPPQRNAESTESQVPGASEASDAPSEHTPRANADAIASTLIESMPAPQEHAIAQAREAAANADTAATDKYGNSFDAAIHAVNADGTPKLTPTGRFAKLPKSSAARGPLNTPAKSVPANGAANAMPTAVSKEVAARASGKGAANLFLMACVGMGGDEWHPRVNEKMGLDEKEMLESCFGDYFVATGKTDLPPGWALLAGIGMYALPRFAMPKTRSRVQRVKEWAVSKYVQFRMRRKVDKSGESNASDK